MSSVSGLQRGSPPPKAIENSGGSGRKPSLAESGYRLRKGGCNFASGKPGSVGGDILQCREGKSNVWPGGQHLLSTWRWDEAVGTGCWQNIGPTKSNINNDAIRCIVKTLCSFISISIFNTRTPQGSPVDILLVSKLPFSIKLHNFRLGKLLYETWKTLVERYRLGSFVEEVKTCWWEQEERAA